MGSIVKVDKRHYRKIAQDNWGLTDEQMSGMHVHHRVPRSKGGTNDASNLYVCSASFHAWIWHNGQFATVLTAAEAGRKGGSSRKGRVMPDFEREKQRQAHLGTKPNWEGDYPKMARTFTPEYRQKLSEAAKRRWSRA